MNTNYLLIGLGLLSIILELILGVATGFDLFLVGLVLIIGGGVGIAFSSTTLSLWTSATLSLLYVFIGRRFLKSKLKIDTIHTSSDGLIGKTAKVTKSISPNHPGQVKLEGETWRAESNFSLAEGDLVVVQSISGVTLKVSHSTT